MIWDLEERVEDAIAAYLRANVGGKMRVYESWNFGEPQFPCVIVHAAETDAVVPEAQWHAPREMALQIAVMTESAPEKVDGVEVRTAREVNAAARSAVIVSLAKIDLLESVIALNPPRVCFSMIQIGKAVRSVEGRTLITTIALDVIAQPTEM